MGAVQKLATVVIIGLVGLATLLVIYLADEPNRRAAEGHEQEEAAIERGIQTYTTYCVQCHGPAGEGYAFKEPGRIGMPLGGRSDRVWVNQTDDPVAWEKQEKVIRNALVNGRGAMPAWADENGGELNDEQINELVTMIHEADWDEVYNEVIEANGGVYPVAVPPSTQGDQPNETGQQPGVTGDTAAVTLEGFDIGWTQQEITVAPGGTINLINSGAAAHNFDVGQLGIVVDMPAGQTVPYTLPADTPPGTYEFICSIPGHAEAGMRGTMIVQAAPAGGAPAASPPAGATPAEGAAPAGGQIAEVTLEGFDIGWTQQELTVTPGTKVKLVNSGAAPHNFEVAPLGINVDMPPGETVEATIPPDAQPGEYDFICNVPGHAEAGMVGKLIVQAPGAAAAPANTGAAPPPAESAPPPAAAAEPVTLEGFDIGWTQKEITVARGGTINLVNAGAAPHNFDVEALGILVDMPPGETVPYTLPADAAPGEYEFICSVPGHAPAGMVGKLIVT